MGDQLKFTLHTSFSIICSFSSLTSLSSACIVLLAMMPFCLTILAKHQAFAPSSPISFCCKFRFFRVEFCRRHSAKAFESSSWIIELWVLSVLPSFLRICQAVEPWFSVWNMVSFIFLHLSHQVWLNLIKNSPQETSGLTIYTSGQSDHHKTTSEESESPRICIGHPRQTPSLCPFRPDSVELQIQVLQGGVLFKAFGQGLTGEIWTSSPALESIELWVHSVPLSSRDFLSSYWIKGWGMRHYKTYNL